MGHRFQVRAYSGEPSPAKFARNLLSHDWRNASKLSEPSDDPGELGPEVPLVGVPFAFTCRRERLAGTGAGNNSSAGGPTGELESSTPAGDAAEKVPLGISHKVGWLNFGD